MNSIIIRRINGTLLCCAALLCVGLTNAMVRKANAQDAPRPVGCEPVIDMTSTCPPWSNQYWSSGTYTICKSASGTQGPTTWCCEYMATNRNCFVAEPITHVMSAGYRAVYQNAYVTPLNCGGTVQGQCS